MRNFCDTFETRKWSFIKAFSVWMTVSLYLPVNFDLNQQDFKNMFRSSHPKGFCEKDVLKNFAKFTEKHLCWRLFFNKVAGLCFKFAFFLTKLLYFPFMLISYFWIKSFSNWIKRRGNNVTCVLTLMDKKS